MEDDGLAMIVGRTGMVGQRPRHRLNLRIRHRQHPDICGSHLRQSVYRISCANKPASHFCASGRMV